MPQVIATKYNLFRAVTVAGAALVNLLYWAESAGHRSGTAAVVVGATGAGIPAPAISSAGARAAVFLAPIVPVVELAALVAVAAAGVVLVVRFATFAIPLSPVICDSEYMIRVPIPHESIELVPKVPEPSVGRAKKQPARERRKVREQAKFARMAMN